MSSRKNRHYAVEKNKAENTSTLLENSLITNYYHCFCCTLFFLSSDIWNVAYIEPRILKSNELWSSQLWTQFKQLHIEAWKSQHFNGVWTRDLAIPVRRSNQLSYEAADVGSWSFVTSNEPVKNGCQMIYEKFHILNCRFWNQVSYDHRSYERSLSNCE